MVQSSPSWKTRSQKGGGGREKQQQQQSECLRTSEVEALSPTPTSHWSPRLKARRAGTVLGVQGTPCQSDLNEGRGVTEQGDRILTSHLDPAHLAGGWGTSQLSNVTFADWRVQLVWSRSSLPDKPSRLIKLHRRNGGGNFMARTSPLRWGTCLPGFHFSKAEIDLEILCIIKGDCHFMSFQNLLVQRSAGRAQG